MMIRNEELYLGTLDVLPRQTRSVRWVVLRLADGYAVSCENLTQAMTEVNAAVASGNDASGYVIVGGHVLVPKAPRVSVTYMRDGQDDPVDEAAFQEAVRRAQNNEGSVEL